MVTILHSQRYGYDVVIHTNEHGPAHVHVYRGGKHLKVQLLPYKEIFNGGFKSRETRRIKALLHEHRALLLQEWARLHGESKS